MYYIYELLDENDNQIEIVTIYADNREMADKGLQNVARIWSEQGYSVKFNFLEATETISTGRL